MVVTWFMVKEACQSTISVTVPTASSETDTFASNEEWGSSPLCKIRWPASVLHSCFQGISE